MTADSLEYQCSKFVKEYNNFHLIRNEIPLPKNVLMTIFKESKSQDPTRDFKKRFQELKLRVKNINILYEVLKGKGILEEINEQAENLQAGWKKNTQLGQLPVLCSANTFTIGKVN